jgi:hypothetical protein
MDKHLPAAKRKFLRIIHREAELQRRWLRWQMGIETAYKNELTRILEMKK